MDDVERLVDQAQLPRLVKVLGQFGDEDWFFVRRARDGGLSLQRTIFVDNVPVPWGSYYFTLPELRAIFAAIVPEDTHPENGDGRLS